MTSAKRSTSRKPAKKTVDITNGERRQMIAEAAYYLAEQRGFQGNCELHDWLEAEVRIEHTYGKAA